MYISDHEMTDSVPEFSSRTTVDSYSQPDHVHVEADEEHTCMSITNRRKRKAKECLLDDLVLSQETDQSLAGGSQVSEASVEKRTGKKVDPFYAAEEMRKLSQFDKKTFLSGQQIASYFSRLAQLDRKADLGDITAAKEEDQKTLLKKEIMDKLNK